MRSASGFDKRSPQSKQTHLTQLATLKKMIQIHNIYWLLPLAATSPAHFMTFNVGCFLCFGCEYSYFLILQNSSLQI